jgi:hypothetical protein
MQRELFGSVPVGPVRPNLVMDLPHPVGESTRPRVLIMELGDEPLGRR